MDSKLRKASHTQEAADKTPKLGNEEIGEDDLKSSPELDEFYKKLQPEMRRPKPGPQEMAAALEAVQRLAVEAGAEDAAAELTQMIASESSVTNCQVCGYRNREGNKFCGMCGQPVEGFEAHEAEPPLPHSPIEHHPRPFAVPRAAQVETGPGANAAPGAATATHHYHHHYHHHYFQGGQDNMMPRAERYAADTRETERQRSPALQTPLASTLRTESMSRAETAIRRCTQEWAVACNTKHLDDLLELYTADVTVIRSNHPPVRGAAAIREFFFGALDCGLGEVDIDPQRIEIAGDFAYASGNCKALVPGASGKRREERGKYLWVLARQSNGEWKIAADSWSSDLTLSPTDPAASNAAPARKP